MRSGVKNGPVKLVAMADVVPAKLNSSYDKLKTQFGGPGGCAAGAPISQLRRLPPGHGFAEARRCGDPRHSSRISLRAIQLRGREGPEHLHGEAGLRGRSHHAEHACKLGQAASQKNLKVAVGLMVRHCRGRQELKQRIDGGQIGDIVAMRAYRMAEASATVGTEAPGRQRIDLPDPELSTPFCGPAEDASAIITSTRSTSAVG